MNGCVYMWVTLYLNPPLSLGPAHFGLYYATGLWTEVDMECKGKEWTNSERDVLGSISGLLTKGFIRRRVLYFISVVSVYESQDTIHEARRQFHAISALRRIANLQSFDPDVGVTCMPGVRQMMQKFNPDGASQYCHSFSQDDKVSVWWSIELRR